MKDELLQIKNISFSYEDGQVLSDINFSLEKGDFLGIIGSNGAGKSTLMKLILGLLPVQEGSISLFGAPVKENVTRIGYVSQKANSFNSSFPATVREVVMASLYPQIGLFRRPKKEHEALLFHVMEEVGMQGFEKRQIGRLSGGQQQRVFIARALINKPDVMILDEPTVGVDAASVDTITDIISRLNQRGVTVIMTNHDTPSLVALSNKLLFLDSRGNAHLYQKSDLSADELASVCAGKGGHGHA